MEVQHPVLGDAEEEADSKRKAGNQHQAVTDQESSLELAGRTEDTHAEDAFHVDESPVGRGNSSSHVEADHDADAPPRTPEILADCPEPAGDGYSKPDDHDLVPLNFETHSFTTETASRTTSLDCRKVSEKLNNGKTSTDYSQHPRVLTDRAPCLSLL